MIALLLAACGPQPTWWEAREPHVTELVTRGPTPSDVVVGDPPPPPGVERVVYRTDPELWGWFWPAEDSPWARDGKVPLVVIVHGGWVFSPSDLTDHAPLHEAGFHLFAPTVRGENGNPGVHELFYGEVSDAIAAVRWAAARPGVDPTRITTFGHSVGGNISALLSLVPGLPVEETASISGLYSPDVFDVWARPFRDTRTERRLRRFEPWAATSMQRPHHAWLATEDPYFHAAADRLWRQQIPLLTFGMVPGDHQAGYLAATRAIRDRLVRRELDRAP